VDGPRAGSTMVAPGELNIMQMKAEDIVSKRFHMHRVLDKSDVFLYLRMPRVMPVTEPRAIDLPEQKLKVGFHRQFLQGFPVLRPKLYPPAFGLRQNPSHQVLHPFEVNLFERF